MEVVVLFFNIERVSDGACIILSALQERLESTFLTCSQTTHLDQLMMRSE
jgi:hypothetical protein